MPGGVVRGRTGREKAVRPSRTKPPKFEIKNERNIRPSPARSRSKEQRYPSGPRRLLPVSPSAIDKAIIQRDDTDSVDTRSSVTVQKAEKEKLQEEYRRPLALTSFTPPHCGRGSTSPHKLTSSPELHLEGERAAIVSPKLKKRTGSPELHQKRQRSVIGSPKLRAKKQGSKRNLVEKEPPATKPMLKEPPRMKPMEKEPPARKPMGKELPRTKPMLKEPPATKPMEKEPPGKSPMGKRPEPAVPVETGPPVTSPMGKGLPNKEQQPVDNRVPTKAERPNEPMEEPVPAKSIRDRPEISSGYELLKSAPSIKEAEVENTPGYEKVKSAKGSPSTEDKSSTGTTTPSPKKEKKLPRVRLQYWRRKRTVVRSGCKKYRTLLLSVVSIITIVVVALCLSMGIYTFMQREKAAKSK